MNMDLKRFQIRIRYCATCNHEPHALAVLERFLKYKIALSEVILEPVEGGVFEVLANGKLIASRTEESGFPGTEEVLTAIRKARSG